MIWLEHHPGYFKLVGPTDDWKTSELPFVWHAYGRKRPDGKAQHMMGYANSRDEANDTADEALKVLRP